MQPVGMKRTLDGSLLDGVYRELNQANTRLSRYYPGEPGERQPVHTVYGGAHLFKAHLARKLGDLAIQSMDAFGGDFVSFARALQMPGAHKLPSQKDQAQALSLRLEACPDNVKSENPHAWLAHTVYKRVRKKLQDEPIEDFRIDFEDGYGNRPEGEEDSHAAQSAEQVAEGMRQNSLPPFIGIRIKPLTEELKERAIRTLDIFLSTLNGLTNGELPENFVVTIPKVTSRGQVDAMVSVFKAFESKTNIAKGSLKMELMLETTPSLVDPNGAFTIPMLLKAGGGRVRGCHFGTYDYTASCNVTAPHQSISHPVCDFARNIMQVNLANTGITISDGATTVMPIPPYRAKQGSPPLSDAQKEENFRVVHNAWRLHFENIMNSLLFGFYQGWDLNPAQLPVRYAAIYTFFLEGLEQAAARLQAFMKQAAQATLVGDIFDDAATGQGLLNYFLRALSCRALTMEEVSKTGLTPEEIQSRSFLKIVANQRKI